MNNHAFEREMKLKKILSTLIFIKDDSIERIKRWDLKLHIRSQLNITDRHCISDWIDTMLADEMISPNPHTQLAHNKAFSAQDSMIIQPRNDTYYIINKANILNWLRTHPTHTTLAQFIQSTTSQVPRETQAQTSSL
jgi:hypothetical protein